MFQRVRIWAPYMVVMNVPDGKKPSWRQQRLDRVAGQRKVPSMYLSRVHPAWGTAEEGGLYRNSI
jgi:hypothetical protein